MWSVINFFLPIVWGGHITLLYLAGIVTPLVNQLLHWFWSAV
ncbi:hypothetical protein JCM19240_4889 [Vibrio maritimus]|uniref:Uncharacterized protein n=1 Tax=Vibrio maritimus TaxID=990268 RepID=A0A090TB56_9VIBR|nr:hypothetical protein JCM19240_4889 [Vibrio maritimus]